MFPADNIKKLERARDSLAKEGHKNPTEEQLKERYLKFGGRIIGDRSSEHGSSPDALIHVVERDVTPETSQEVAEIEKPKRKAKE